MTRFRSIFSLSLGVALVCGMTLASNTVPAAPAVDCPVTFTQLEAALSGVAPDAGNGGLGNNMWATVVNRDGVVCAVAFSTANLWAATQPGGSLWELTQSNPVDTATAYLASFADYGTSADPLVGERMGGVNVFGGGLALYDSDGMIVGAVGVSGDTSCADHNIGWRVRDALDLDFVPSGVAGALVGGDTDNIIFDIQSVSGGHVGHPETVSATGFGHPICGIGEDTANATIVAACPTGDGTTANLSPDCPSLTP